MQKEEEKSSVPGVWSALAAGFDLTAKHPWLLLLPIVLDVFIWLGPRLRFQTIIEQIVANLPEEAEVLTMAEQLLEIGPQTNLFTVFSVPLVGVPVLLAGLSPETTPLAPQIFDISNGLEWFGLLFAVSLAGLLFTALYYETVASVVSKRLPEGTERSSSSALIRIVKNWLRLVVLGLLFFVITLIFYMPVSIIGAIMFLLNSTLGTVVLLLAPLLLIWVIIYLSFAPPGIAVNDRPVIQAVKESLRLVQTNLTAVLTLLLVILLLGAVLDWLLLLAENGTWLTLFNILIHAFVNTAFVSAFFILYQDRAAVLFNGEPVAGDGSL